MPDGTGMLRSYYDDPHIDGCFKGPVSLFNLRRRPSPRARFDGQEAAIAVTQPASSHDDEVGLLPRSPIQRSGQKCGSGGWMADSMARLPKRVCRVRVEGGAGHLHSWMVPDSSRDGGVLYTEYGIGGAVNVWCVTRCREQVLPDGTAYIVSSAGPDGRTTGRPVSRVCCEIICAIRQASLKEQHSPAVFFTS
jgi:hypothetical protein